MSDSDHGAIKKKTTQDSKTMDNSAAEQWTKGDELGKGSGDPSIAKTSSEETRKRN